MELTELKFAVNTDALEEAVTKLKALGVAVSDYNKVNGDRARTDRESAAAARELAKEQKAQEKATKKAAAEAERLAAAQKKLGETAGTATDEMSPLEKLLEKLNNKHGDMIAGFTRGEAAILQQARNFGAVGDQLTPFIEILKETKKLFKDTFDDSVGAVRSISGELERLTQRANLTTQGISLTTKQLSEYSRISAEIAGQVKILGFDPKSADGLAKHNTMLAKTQAEYLATAADVNRLTEEEKQRNAVLREQEKLAASTLRAQQRALEENATSMNQAVAEFRRLEKAKADAAQSAADRIVKANAAAAESAARLNQIASMVRYTGTSEKEASKRVDMASQGVSADVINQVIAAEKNLASTRVTGTRTTTSYDAAAKELTKAKQRLLKEEEKMISVLATLNEQQNNSVTFNEKAARSIFNYEQDLKKAGTTAADSASKLALYKNQQKEVLAVEQKRQAEYLKRGLQPQIGDVAVSLAAGQNPLTVLLQQGDQIRGLIAQTGIEGKQLQTVMREALGDTIKSIQQTAVAMGSVLGGAISSAGKAITGLVTGPIAAWKSGYDDAKAAGNSTFASVGAAFSSAFSAGSMASLAAIPTILTAGAVALVTFGIAAYQVMKQEEDLSKALILTGGSLGLTLDSAKEYAKSMESVGISSSKAIEVLTQMGKTGGFVRSEFELVIKSATEMEKWLGVSIEDTVKSFAKLKDKPVEGLIELAKATGLVRPEVIQLAYELEQQGRKSEAVALAMKTQGAVTKEQVEQMKIEYTTFGKFLIDLKDNISKFWQGVQGLIRQDSSATILETQIDAVRAKIKDTKDNFDLLKKFNLASLFKSNTNQVDTNFQPITGLDELESQEKALVKQLATLRERNSLKEVEQAFNAQAATEFKANAAFVEEWEKKRAALDTKKLTRLQAIAKAEADAVKAGVKLTPAQTMRVRETAGLEWDKSQASSQNKSQNAINKALDSYNDILNKTTGVNADFNDKVKEQNLLREKGLKTEEEYALVINALVNAQPYAIKAKKDEADATTKLIKAQETLNDILGISSGVSSSFNNELEAIQLVYAQTDMSAQAYTEAVLKLLDKQPYAIKAKQDEAKALSDLNRAQETYNDILGISSGVSADFNNKLESLQLYYNNNKISAEAYSEAVLKLLEKQPYAIKLLADEEKVRSELAKKVKEHADELKKLTEATDNYNHSLQKEYEALLLEKELMGLSEEDRTARLNILKVEQKYLEEVEAAQKAYNITFEEYIGLLDKAKANRDLGLKVVNEKADVAAIKKINDEYNKFVGNLAGAISQNIVEGGKDGSDKLRGIIEAELSKPITVFINAIIQDIFSENKSGKSFSERISSSQETFDVASKFSKFGFKGAELLSSMGFDTASEMLGQFSAGVKNASSMGGFKGAMEAGGANLAGAIGGAVLNGLSGYSISKSLAGGYAIEGLNVDLIAGIASAIPGVGPIAGVIGGLFQRAFGMAAKEIQAQGITGTFSAISGAMVSQYTDWTQKGGWFRSDRSGRDSSNISKELDQTLDSAISSMTFAAFDYANILGLSADGIMGVTQAIDISLKDLTPEQQKKKIEEALTGFGDKLAQTLGFETQDALNKFAEQVMSQRNALELEFLKLQGNAVELRKRERDTIYKTNLPLYDRINALKDLEEVENKALKQLEERKRAESEAIDELKKATQVLDDFKSSGKTIADFIATLIGSVSSDTANLKTTKAAYMSNLALANTGDQSALGGITSTASSYLEKVKQTATSTVEYRKAAALVAVQLQQIPAVKLWQESMLDKLDVIASAIGGTTTAIGGTTTAIGGTTTSIDLVKKAQDDVKAATADVATKTEAVKTATETLSGIQALSYNKALLTTALNSDASLNNDVIMAQLLKGIADSNAKMAETPAVSTSTAKGGGGLTAGETIAVGVGLGALAFLLFSDERTKQNITPYKTLDNGINLYDYNYKAPYSGIYGSDKKRGVLAQEIEQQYPAAVREGANGMKMVDYSQLPIPRDMLKFANGAAFTNSIVSNPTAFNIGQMGEAGPEAIMPLQRMPNGSLGVGSSNDNSSAVVDVLERLNANIEGLRSEVRADVTHNAKTAKLLDRVIPEGDSIAVTANFDGGLI